MKIYESDIYMLLLCCLINYGYLKYESLNDNVIKIGNNHLSIKRDELGQVIYIENVYNKNTSLQKYIKKYIGQTNYIHLMRMTKRSLINKKQYLKDYYSIFKEINQKNFDEIFSDSNSIEYIEAIINRINNKNYIEKYYPFFHYNELPRYLRSNNSLKRKIFLLDKENSRDSNIYILFKNYFPIIRKPENYSHEESFYFLSSHRTFTSTDSPFYFKIDLPYRISSSNRKLTRNKSRINASNISHKYIQRYSKDMNMWILILKDIESYTHKNKNLMIRKKCNWGVNIPLFALTGPSPFENNNTLLDYLLSDYNDLEIIDFIFNNIISPIIKVFMEFLSISILYGDGKLIMPSDFHSQNVNILITNKKNFQGISFQDLDMSLTLNKYNVSSQYDFFIGEFIFKPIEYWLIERSYMNETDFRNRTKKIFYKYASDYLNYFHKSGIFKNLLHKDIDGDKSYIYLEKKLYR
ncbi:hypothetical protein GH131_10480 [Staphylococcus pseudintermedius]|nr:hypothetical protein [Staphylococcus pseudintermedius]